MLEISYYIICNAMDESTYFFFTHLINIRAFFGGSSRPQLIGERSQG